MFQDEQAHLMMQKARVSMLSTPKLRMFANLGLRLELVEDPSCDAMWTDGTSLGYNPSWVKARVAEADWYGLRYAVAHEVVHPSLGHHVRRGGRDRDRWNQACDFKVAEVLELAGLTAPAWVLRDPDFDRLMAEEVYGKLRPKADPSGGEDGQSKASAAPDGSQQAQGGAGAGNGQQPSQGTPGDPSQQAPGASQGVQQQPATQGPPNEQGAQGSRQDASSKKAPGEVRDARSPDGSAKAGTDAKADEMRWKRHLAQALAQAQAEGGMTGELEAFVKAQLEPAVDWREELRNFLDQNLKDDFDFSRPNRMYLEHYDLYVPSLHSEGLGNVVFVVDTSGSTWHEDLFARTAAEILSVVEEFHATLTAIYADSAVRSVQTVEWHDLPVDLKPTGGGGTNFRPAFEYIEDHDLNPVAVVYFTDLVCSRYPDEPAYPVLWAKHGGARREPPFGDVIQLR